MVTRWFRPLALLVLVGTFLAVAGGASAEPTATTSEAPQAQSSIAITGPNKLIIGDQRELVLQVVAKELSRLRVDVSVGEASWADQDGTLRFVPPKERYPQVALIAVSNPDTGEVAQHRIALFGRAKVVISSEPNVSVDVFVEEQRYGPIQTDRGGKGRVEVLVPPGVSAAKTLARDDYDNVREGEVDLEVPDFSRHLLLCRPKHGEVLVLGSTTRGEPSRDVDFKLSSSDATFAEPVEVQPGLFRVPIVFLQSATEGATAQIELSESGERVQRCGVIVKKPPPPPEPPPPPLPKPRVSVVPTEPDDWPEPYNLLVKAGYISNFSKVNAPLFAVRGEYAFRYRFRGVRLGAEVAVFRGAESLTSREGRAVELTTTAMPVVATARYQKPVGPIFLSAGVAAGVLLTAIEASAEEPRPARTQASDLVPAVGASGAAGYPLSLGALVLESGFLYASSPAELNGGVAGVHAALGWSVAL